MDNEKLPVQVDKSTGEIAERSPEQKAVQKKEETILPNPYQEIATLELTKEQKEQLTVVVPDEDIELRPDGLIYLPEIRFRKVLNKVFGPGKWAIQPRGIEIHNNVMCYRGALYIEGKFVAEAIGEQEYFPSNRRMTYATAAEAAKSNCLVRCCKDLGIAWNLWDPEFVKKWLEKYAVEVWCVAIGGDNQGQKKKLWRKKTDPPIDEWPWREIGDGTSTVTEQPKPKPTPKKKVIPNEGIDDKDKEIQGKLGNLLLDISDGDIVLSKQLLYYYSSFENKEGAIVAGKKQLKELTGKWLASTYGKVKKAHEEWEADKDKYWGKMTRVLENFEELIEHAG